MNIHAMVKSPPARGTEAARVRRSPFLAVAAMGVLTGVAAPAEAAFVVTFENPGVTSANVANLCAGLGAGTCTVGVETFDARPLNQVTNFTTDFGTGGRITGTYSNVAVVPGSPYGGVDGSPYPFTTLALGSYTVSLATTLPTGMNYFGYWLSALDPANYVRFYSGNQMVFEFKPQDVIDRVGSCVANAYCGHPNGPYAGANADEQYVFVNFFSVGETFDRLVFSQEFGTGGYESDNHTVGYVTRRTGTPVTPVPEPSSLALLATGLLGLAWRRRRGSSPSAGRPRHADAA